MLYFEADSLRLKTSFPKTETGQYSLPINGGKYSEQTKKNWLHIRESATVTCHLETLWPLYYAMDVFCCVSQTQSQEKETFLYTGLGSLSWFDSGIRKGYSS